MIFSPQRAQRYAKEKRIFIKMPWLWKASARYSRSLNPLQLLITLRTFAVQEGFKNV